jgi:hypothetical protein
MKHNHKSTTESVNQTHQQVGPVLRPQTSYKPKHQVTNKQTATYKKEPKTKPNRPKTNTQPRAQVSAEKQSTRTLNTYCKQQLKYSTTQKQQHKTHYIKATKMPFSQDFPFYIGQN